MRIEIEMLGPLRKYVKDGAQKATLDVQPGATVGEVLEQMGLDERESWNASIEGRIVSPTQSVEDGAHILVFPPIVGG